MTEKNKNCAKDAVKLLKELPKINRKEVGIVEGSMKPVLEFLKADKLDAEDPLQFTAACLMLLLAAGKININ